MDDPDLSIRADRLVDDSPGEIKTVTADSTMYTSGGRVGGRRACWFSVAG